MRKRIARECEELVLQAMEAVQEGEKESFAELFYPIPAGEWEKETGEKELPEATRFRQALSELGGEGFSAPFELENLYVIKEYYGRNWYEARGIPVAFAVDATVYWAINKFSFSCCGWPVTFQCLYIGDVWYLNPYWLWEYLKD